MPEAVLEAANVVPKANVTMPEADVSPNRDEKNQCVRCKEKMHRDYLCVGCDRPIHWFCADGDSIDNETKGHGKKYWCPPCFSTSRMITQDEDAHSPSSQKENVLPINHDTPGRGMMQSIASGKVNFEHSLLRPYNIKSYGL